MNKYVERLYNGIIKENPTFVLMLGMCPTLAVTSSAVNGIGNAGHVPHVGGNIFCSKRDWHGPFHHGSAGNVQPADFHVP